MPIHTTIIPSESVEKVTRNRYQAVIVASKRARMLNAQRLMQLAALEQGGSFDIDGRKITLVALKDLVEGRVKFSE